MYINQKQLIHDRKKYGIKTIKEAKTIRPDRIEEKKSPAGYRVFEYLYDVERLQNGGEPEMSDKAYWLMQEMKDIV